MIVIQKHTFCDDCGQQILPGKFFKSFTVTVQYGETIKTKRIDICRKCSSGKGNIANLKWMSNAT